MDTPTAITTLQTLSAQLRSNALGFNAQADAVDVAVMQLQGILDTEKVDADQAAAQEIADGAG